jgi:hypothetical protein
MSRGSPLVIDGDELAEARAFLGEFSSPQLRQLARVLWPAAAIGEAGPLSCLALELIDDELGEREQAAA